MVTNRTLQEDYLEYYLGGDVKYECGGLVERLLEIDEEKRMGL